MARVVADRFALDDKKPRGGGSALVFGGVDLQNDMRRVAVKVFDPPRRVEERYIREFFSRELAALMSLRDQPNVVQVIDFGSNDGEGNPFIVLQWVDGDLLDFLERSPCDGWDDFAPVALGILRGLAAAHAIGRWHRDVKPQNVLIGADGIPKVADFGISKLRDRISQGITFSGAGAGTQPYVPPAPEQDDGNFTGSRDVFGFAVLVIRCLAGVHLDTYADVRQRIEDGTDILDLPSEVLDFLRRATSLKPSERPPDAQAALQELESFQRLREASWAPKLEIHIQLAPKAADQIAARLDADIGDVADFLLSDVESNPRIARAPDREVREGGGRFDDDLFLLGETFVYRLRPDRGIPGVLTVIGATKFPPSEMEVQRSRAWWPNLVIRRTLPIAVERAVKTLESLRVGLAEFEQQQADAELRERERILFRSWRNLLEAKRRIEDKRGLPVRFRSASVSGRRVRFEISEAPTGVTIDEPRLVRVPHSPPIRGEVEDVAENSITLFVEKGDVSMVPRAGMLEFDADAARFGIDRQRDALEAVRHRRSVRTDLGDLLLKPNLAQVPEPVAVAAFANRNLDTAKRKAIEASLGATDFVLVEGPPGTGKTTFIAELVTQYLAASPGKRVLLSSQTHIALDNALDQIQRLAPDRTLLRIGRSERIAVEVDALRLERQMEKWRSEVLASSKHFLRQYAKKHGIETSAIDLAELASALEQVRQSLHELRSRVQLRQAERRVLADQLAEVQEAAPEVLVLSERIEAALRAGAPDLLKAAAETFLEHGIDLAARLETGGVLSARLAEFEATLSEWRADIETLAAAEVDRRAQLASSLGIAYEGEPPAAQELLDQAAAPITPEHEGYARLQGLYGEWEQRFGRGPQFNAALLERADVVAATCVGLAGVRGVLEVTFDLCIVDEASKATATEVLVPLSRAKSWVLVGDRKQLPPFQDAALLDPAILAQFELSPMELEQTLFDHLAEALPESARFALSKQYRMVPAIGRLISDCFYTGLLESDDREPDALIATALQGAVVWSSTSQLKSHYEQDAGRNSYLNQCEAHIIRDQLQRLQFVLQHSDRMKHNPKPVSVVVLTGYAEQREYLRRLLETAMPEWSCLLVQVATVDSFQGKEADVAIFSLTRSNSEGRLGFLESSRRVNVALSRGRDGLLIVGDHQMVQTSRARNNPLLKVLNYIDAASDCRLEVVDA